MLQEFSSQRREGKSHVPRGQGTQGTKGSQGTQGTQRTQGSQGTQGMKGAKGSQGTQGMQGHRGRRDAAALADFMHCLLGSQFNCKGPTAVNTHEARGPTTSSQKSKGKGLRRSLRD